MYKATREFIKARQPHAKHVVEVATGIRKIGGGVEAKCFNNAQNQIDHSKGIHIVSGWLVNRYDKDADLTAIIQHWWNADKSGFFDTSPNIDPHFEYVIDMDLALYAAANEDKIQSRVAFSLMLKDGQYSLIDMDEHKVTQIPIKTLETPSLFRYVHAGNG